jgi:hypothetical protein
VSWLLMSSFSPKFLSKVELVINYFIADVCRLPVLEVSIYRLAPAIFCLKIEIAPLRRVDRVVIYPKLTLNFSFLKSLLYSL